MAREAGSGRLGALKIVLVGQMGVGKSCILDRQLHNSFEDQMPGTIGTAFATAMVETPTGMLRLQFWDTAGQEQYVALAAMYYRNAHIALLVFDLTRRDTLLALERWAAEVKERAPANITLMLVGNKSDLEELRAISLNEAARFRERIGTPHYFETSAKTGAGLERLFKSICTLSPGPARAPAAGQVSLADRNTPEKGCCG
jgi:small GTP-binding protein